MSTQAEYPATIDLEEVADLAHDDAIPFDVDVIRGDFPILERTAGTDSSGRPQPRRCPRW